MYNMAMFIGAGVLHLNKYGCRTRLVVWVAITQPSTHLFMAVTLTILGITSDYSGPSGHHSVPTTQFRCNIAGRNSQQSFMQSRLSGYLLHGRLVSGLHFHESRAIPGILISPVTSRILRHFSMSFAAPPNASSLSIAVMMRLHTWS